MARTTARILFAAALLLCASEAHAQVTPAKPSNDPATWVTESDYPIKALRDGAEGMVRFLLVIDANGAVIGCTVETSSGSALLDDATCRLLTARAVFQPAKGSDGRPREGAYRAAIKWQLPPPPPAAETVMIEWPDYTAKPGSSLKLIVEPANCHAKFPDKRLVLPAEFCRATHASFSQQVKRANLTAVSWPADRLPRLDGLRDLGPPNYKLLFEIDRRGRISNCRWDEGRGPNIAPEEFCLACTRHIRARNPAGTVGLDVSFFFPERQLLALQEAN